jgi:hypothetical protein
VEQLSPEDKEGLLAYLLHSLHGAPQGPDDGEVIARDADMKSGAVKPLSHEDFIGQVRPDRQ